MDKLTESLMEADAETIRSLRLENGKLKEALERINMIVVRGHAPDDVAGAVQRLCTAALSTPGDGLWQEVRWLLEYAEVDVLSIPDTDFPASWDRRRDALLGRKP